jgi:FkbM family methyltransferase
LNPSGKNYGFEPVPFLYEKAKRNIELNEFTNIFLNNLAVSDRSGTLFFEAPSNRNFGSINMSLAPTKNSKKVNALTFDEFIDRQKIDKVDFIKIDVEGFEYKVVDGAIKSIEQYKPILFIELIDEYLKKNGNSAAALVAKISKLGYCIYDADDNSIINSDNAFDKKHIDILCLPCH